jgi:hypothetical protein
MNPETKITLSHIKQICEKHGIVYLSHERLTRGFSHEVHRINDDLVIKIFSKELSDAFQTERAALASDDNFQKPKLVASGTPGVVVDSYYIIMSYISGKSLGSVWHLANDTQREKVIASISKNLQIINTINPASLQLQTKASWYGYLLDRTNTLVNELVEKHTIDAAMAERIHDFTQDHQSAFTDTVLRTTYWDIHFDNFIVNESFELQAIIDLENIELTSLDYPLFVIRKQMNDPMKYLSLEDEKHAKREDYEKLESWYRIYYPEMFAFDFLERRLEVYQLLDTLRLLKDWPQVKELYVSLHDLVGV